MSDSTIMHTSRHCPSRFLAFTPLRCPHRPAARFAGRSMRRGFNLVELLMALAIAAALLTATMVALNASFTAYQATTEVASTHTIGRLAMSRMLTLIRTGSEFGPRPALPTQSVVFSDFIEFRMPNGEIMTIVWREEPGSWDGMNFSLGEALYVIVPDSNGVATPYVLLEGVKAAYDEDNQRIAPFTLEYEKGYKLYRATIDLTLQPDDNMNVNLDGDNSSQLLRLVASAMPRNSTY